MAPNLLEAVKANTTIDGEVYAVPHQWGTSGMMADKTKAPDVKGWDDLCDPQYAGRTSMRLRRTILLGTAFSMGMDPFALYADPDAYQKMLDEVTEKLIACKSNIKTYWTGGDDLSALMLSGEVVVVGDLGLHRLQALLPEPRTSSTCRRRPGRWPGSTPSPSPRSGEADDAAYKWINFVTAAGDRDGHVGLHRRHRRGDRTAPSCCPTTSGRRSRRRSRRRPSPT